MRFYVNFLTNHTDPNIYSMTPIFRETLEYMLYFQEISGLSPTDQQQLQMIRENSFFSIFESVDDFFRICCWILDQFSTCQTDPNIYFMTPVFRATLEYWSNFQKIFGLNPPDQQRLQTIQENSVLLIF